MAEAAPDNGAVETLPDRWTASAKHPDMWMDPDADPRFTAPEPEAEDEKSNILVYLRGYRITMELKCADLDTEQLARRSVPPSTMSLLGLIRHMADVERYWFRRVLGGADAPALYWSDDVADADWNGAVADPEVVAEAWQAWRAEVAFAEAWIGTRDDMGLLGTMSNGKTVSLRDVLVHMVEEYARHCGHADLIRERIDGRIGQ